MTVGDRIRQVREEKNFSLGELANKCGITRQRLWQIELAQSAENPKINTLWMIANALNCSIPYLLIGTAYELPDFNSEKACSNYKICPFFKEGK